MKRLSSSDSLGGLMSICPNSTDEHSQGNNHMYTREFQTMLEGLDEEGCIEESGHVSEKKRRLSVDQVKALEKNFEVENKLEPERKVKLAQELGLQPRQVAVWFQNRRARWKTKQLERDYGVLKANFDGLKLNFEKLQHDNESLLKEIRELKSKLNEDDSSEEKSKLGTPVNSLDKSDEDATEIENFNGNKNGELVLGVAAVFGDFKDGSSDSDSSAIVNEDHNNNNNNNNGSSPMAGAAISSSGGINVNIHHNPHQFLNGSSTTSSSSMNMNFHHFVKIEEHNFFSEESCTTFFSDDQAPTLPWYCSHEWN